MREGYDADHRRVRGARHQSARSTSRSYGAGIEDRLTGLHETAPWTEFSYGVSDRGASVRIPWQVEVDKKGYIEDRRPNANMDPYVVTRLIIDTVLLARWRSRPAPTVLDTRPGSRTGSPGVRTGPSSSIAEKAGES